MTPRERWLAALRLQPVDRLPFWPKLDTLYPAMQREPYTGMSLSEVHEFIGSDRYIGLGSCAREKRQETSYETETNGDIHRGIFHTPIGSLTTVRRKEPISQTWHPTEFPIKTRDDIRIMTRFYQDAQVELNPDALLSSKATCAEIADKGITGETVGTSPLMHFIQWLAGIENCHYMLQDCQAEVEELFNAMQQNLLAKVRLVAENSPTDMIWLSENTSTTLISPAQYRTYCKPCITECGNILREAGKILVLHMCGHLKALLPDLATVPANAFEAFTSPTLGNTTLLDGRLACPDKCLIGGTNATLWTQSASQIIQQIEQDLDELPHHRGIVVTSAGLMPPTCTPDTMKEVRDYVVHYTVRV